MSHNAGAQKGKVSGVGEIRDKDGNLKGTLVIEGETTLSPEELSKALGIPIEQSPPDEEDK